MRKLFIALLITVTALLAVPAASVANTNAPIATEASLSKPSAFATTTQTLSDGSSLTSTFSPDNSTALSIGGDGYPCDDVGYYGTVRWITLWGTLTSWTYRVHFGVHVCHNKVGKFNNLYDDVMSIIPTWSWCGTVVHQWGPTLPASSAHSYMKGCFQLVSQIIDQKFPWVKITIGGNGGLWVRETGVDG